MSSWRLLTATSPNSWPTCPMSCARRSTPSSVLEVLLDKMFGDLNAKQESTSMIS